MMHDEASIEEQEDVADKVIDCIGAVQQDKKLYFYVSK